MIKTKIVIFTMAIIAIAISAVTIIKAVNDGTSVTDETIRSNQKMYSADENDDVGQDKQPVEKSTPFAGQTNELNQVLIKAAAKGNPEKVKQLVEKGANVNAINNLAILHDCSVLMVATLKGHLDIVKFLVDNGADVNFIATGKHYFGTALMMASKERKFDIVKFLVVNGADVNAITNGHEYYKVDYRMPYSGTALMLASDEGHVDIVKFLVNNGADVNAVATIDDLEKGTALIAASQKGHFDIVKFLVENGADVNAVTTGEMENYTALIAASIIGNLDIVKFLIANGADVNVVVNHNYYSGTALIIASKEGYLDIVKFLIANEAHINVIATGDVFYGTALMMASKEGNWDTVRFLIDYGAEIDATYHGKTAQDYAIEYAFTEVSEYLEILLKYNPYVSKPLTSAFTYFTQAEDIKNINTQLSVVKGLLKKEGRWTNNTGNYQQISEAPDKHLEITIDVTFENNKLVFKYGTDPQSEKINDHILLNQQLFIEDTSNTHAYLIFPEEWKLSQQFQVIKAIQNSSGSLNNLMACLPESTKLSSLLRKYNIVLERKYEFIESDKPQLEKAVQIISEGNEKRRIEKLQEKYKDYQIHKIPFYIPEGITQAYSIIGRTHTIYFDKSSLTGNGKILIEIPQITFRRTTSGTKRKACLEGLTYELDFAKNKKNYKPEYQFEETSTGLKKKTIDLGDDITMELVYIPAGEFMMGSHSDANMGFLGSNEKPQHKVKISKGFWMGVNEVTNGQYQQFLKDSNYDGEREANANYLRHMTLTPDFNTPEEGSDYPVVWVSWNNARAFCEWLSVKESKTYRLPTEAQWEYACRAGRTKELDIKDDGLFLNSSGGRASSTRGTHPAGQNLPNSFGLCDMFDNVKEWCRDWYGSYSNTTEVDPKGPSSGDSRVVRGDYSGNIISYRCAKRSCYPPDKPDNKIGFRVVCISQ